VKQDQDKIQTQCEEEEEDGERRAMRVVLGRPQMPEPLGLRKGHRHHHHQHHSGSEQDETELMRSSSTFTSTSSPPPPALLLKLSSPTVIDELFERLVSFSTQLKSAVELLLSLQARHTTAQSTIDALKSAVTSLESLVNASQTAFPFPPFSSIPTLISSQTTTTPRLPHTNAHRLEKISQWPMVFHMQATGLCTGRMGVESWGCGSYAWEYGSEV
jgi:hypothetical protein